MVSRAAARVLTALPWVIAVAVLAPLALGRPGGSTVSAAGNEAKIGVVDFGKVFKSYAKSADLEKKINDEAEDLKKQLDEQRKLVDKINDELDLLEPDTQTFDLKEEERALAIARGELLKRRAESVIKRRWEQYNRALIEDIDAAVRAYGEENKFTLILKIDSRDQGEKRLVEIGLSSVVYHDKTIDVTEAVVRVLNSRHAVGGAAPVPAPAAGPSDKSKPNK